MTRTTRLTEPIFSIEETLAKPWEEGFRRDPTETFRRWFRLQEKLGSDGESGAGTAARALADDFWRYGMILPHETPAEAARFFNGVGAFFGAAGPAADLGRARACFERALAETEATGDPDTRARILHNFASALAGLGSTPGELAEAVAKFRAALEWRTAEREIARAVTLHNMGVALAAWARVEPGEEDALLLASAETLSEAAEIRGRLGLARGHALSLLHLGMVRKLAGASEDADRTLREAAARLTEAGLQAEAERAREAIALGTAGRRRPENP